MFLEIFEAGSTFALDAADSPIKNMSLLCSTFVYFCPSCRVVELEGGFMEIVLRRNPSRWILMSQAPIPPSQLTVQQQGNLS